MAFPRSTALGPLLVILRSAPAGALNSSLSWLPVHPGSCRSTSPSPSLSRPSWHSAFGNVSSSSVGELQLKSFGKSVAPSLSLSTPSEHCGGTGQLTVVETTALWLFAGLGSVELWETEAAFCTVPPQVKVCETVKATVKVRNCPAVSEVLLQMTLAPTWTQLTSLEGMKVRPCGTTSLTSTLVAVAGPRLTTVSV